MSVVISQVTGGGQRRQCNGTCHNAKKPKCVCICGGRFHGAVRDGTLDTKVEEFGKETLQKINAERPPERHLIFAGVGEFSHDNTQRD